MFDKIDITGLITNHIKTLYNQGEDFLSWEDITLFFVAPGVLSIIVLSCGTCMPASIADGAFTTLSIFTALLFNLPMLLYDILDKSKVKSEHSDESDRRKLIKELYHNVCFAILVSIATLPVVVVLKFEGINKWVLGSVQLHGWTIEPMAIGHWLALMDSAIFVWLISVLFLTFLMILKRIHALLLTQNPQG